MRRSPTTQQISWFLDLERNNQLDLNPPYQRKSVWSPKDRRFFLDTIFRNYPAPPIFVHRTIDDNGSSTYHIVDGKQRLETILNFAKNKIAIDASYGDVNFNGKRFNDLDNVQKRLFWDYTLVVDFIDTIDGSSIEQVFDRVNRNSRNLQPQELRHARFNGWFVNESENESEEGFWIDIKVSTRAKDKRMKNVQLISELLLIILDSDITGFSQDYLNDQYAQYDDPEETMPEFDHDTYIEEKNRIKSYINRMEVSNNCITNHAKTANNLYTIWALIALKQGDLPEADVLAASYDTFMNKVNDINAIEDLEQFDPGSDLQLVYANTYLKNSKGAATELPQRKARLNALITALLG